MRSFSELWGYAEGIEGWLAEGQGHMLYEAARNIGPGRAIVEIGSHHGRSTIILALAKPEGATLLAVDPYGDPRWGGGEAALEIFRANLAKHRVAGVDHARLLGAEAGRAWHDGPVGVLFVDGAHDYPSVSADLEAWVPHLSPGATVLIHDGYSSPGVTRAVFARMFGARDFAFAGSSRSLVQFERCSPGILGRLRSSAGMLAKLPWFARNLAVKFAYRRGWRPMAQLLGHRGPALPY